MRTFLLPLFLFILGFAGSITYNYFTNSPFSFEQNILIPLVISIVFGFSIKKRKKTKKTTTS